MIIELMKKKHLKELKPIYDLKKKSSQQPGMEWYSFVMVKGIFLKSRNRVEHHYFDKGIKKNIY